MNYDYVLFDNLTLGPTGHTDWRVKAAVGDLEGHSEAMSKFAKYGWFSIRHGLAPLRGFGSALGGIRLNNGYLVCVSIETRDRSDRLSYAVVGIFCSGTAGLKVLLTGGNPIQMARGVYKGKPPGSSELAGSPIAEDFSAGPSLPEGLHRFGDSSPKDVAALLIRSANRGHLPSVRGIACFDDDAKLLNGFEHAFCLGLPKHLEARHQPAVVERPERSTWGLRWILGVTALAAVTAIVWLIPRPQPATKNQPAMIKPSPPDTNADVETPSPTPPRLTESDKPLHENAEEFLTQFDTSRKQLQNFPLSELKKTREFSLLTSTAIRVTGEFEAPRKKMIHLIELDLPDFQDNVSNKNFDHYYPPETKGLTPDQRAQEIRKRLAELKPPKEECDLIRKTFQMWTNSNGPTHDWCGVVDTFAALVAAEGGRR